MIKMVKELEKLIVNYEKLKRDLTGHDLNSLELISELEGLFNNIDINHEEWYLTDEVASNNIEIDVNYKKSKDKEEPKEIEEFKIKQTKDVLKDLEDINSKLIKIKTSLYDYTKISDVIYFLNDLLTRNEPDLTSSLSPSISMMIYDGLRAVKQNAQFMQDIYLDYYRKTSR